MGLTNFPGGIASMGIPLPAANMYPPGGAVRFVGNRSGLPASTGKDAAHPYSTLAAALADSKIAVASSCGTVYVLPGHSESTTTTVLTGLVAGTRIVGLGEGLLRPTFRLTATGAQLAISVANVTFENVVFRLEGANGITKAINVTGANVKFINCEFEVASGASNKSTIALEIGTGANRCKILGCTFRGTATHNVTDGIKVAGAVDQIEIANNVMVFSATAGNGLIHVTAAATNMKIYGNILHNTHTSSTACIKLDDVASTGFLVQNYSANENDGTASAQGVVFAGTTNCTVKCAECYSADEKGKNSILGPAVNT